MDIFEYFDQENDLYICGCDVSCLDISKYAKYFSEYRLQKIKRIKKENAKLQSAGAELMLVHAVSKFFGKEYQPVKYTTDEYGRPIFTEFKDLFFNLSHSGDIAVCAVSNSYVGVDVQKHRNYNDGIVKRFFTDNEYDIIKTSPDYMFNLMWTRKEAVSKAVGRGLGIGLTNIDVSGDIVRYGDRSYLTYNPNIDYGGYYFAVSKLIY